MVVAVSMCLGLTQKDGEMFDLIKQLDVFFNSFGAAFSESSKLSAHWEVYSMVYMQVG